MYENIILDRFIDAADDTAQYAAVFGEVALETRPCLNIGSGFWRHPVWRTLDQTEPPYDQYGEPDYNIDLSKQEQWPTQAGELKLAYCSHVLEHLTDEITLYVLREAYRSLDKGGILRIVVPDIETAYWAYKLNDYKYYDERSTGKPVKRAEGRVAIASTIGHAKGRSLKTQFFLRFASCLGLNRSFDGLEVDDAVDDVFARMSIGEACEHFLASADFATKRPSLHINWYDGDKLKRLLLEAGFSNAVRTSYGQSLSPLLRNKHYFDTTRPGESLYVDAIKL